MTSLVCQVAKVVHPSIDDFDISETTKGHLRARGIATLFPIQVTSSMRREGRSILWRRLKPRLLSKNSRTSSSSVALFSPSSLRESEIGPMVWRQMSNSERHCHGVNRSSVAVTLGRKDASIVHIFPALCTWPACNLISAHPVSVAVCPRRRPRRGYDLTAPALPETGT